MKIVNVFDAVQDGTFGDFLEFYKGNINQINPHTQLNLLETAVLNDGNSKDKLNIIKFLISNKIDHNFTDSKYGRNALHTLYFNTTRGTNEFLLEVTKLLVEAGININAVDKYNAIPLKYAITVCKRSTEEMKDLYLYLLTCGSDYKHQDSFGKSCEDYAKEYSWRNGFLDIVREFEGG